MHRVSHIANKTRCAVFIDGAKMPSDRAVDIMNTAMRVGNVISVNLFADFTKNTHKSWCNPCLAYNMNAIQVFEDNRNKWIHRPCIQQTLSNSCTLETNVDKFVIAFGNGRNYVDLVHTLKTDGKSVIGIGTSPDLTCQNLVDACDSFIYINSLSHPKQYCDDLTQKKQKKQIINIIRDKSQQKPYPVNKLTNLICYEQICSHKDVLKFILELDEPHILVTFDRRGTPYVEYVDTLKLFPRDQ